MLIEGESDNTAAEVAESLSSSGTALCSLGGYRTSPSFSEPRWVILFMRSSLNVPSGIELWRFVGFRRSVLDFLAVNTFAALRRQAIGAVGAFRITGSVFSSTASTGSSGVLRRLLVVKMRVILRLRGDSETSMGLAELVDASSSASMSVVKSGVEKQTYFRVSFSVRSH